MPRQRANRPPATKTATSSSPRPQQPPTHATPHPTPPDECQTLPPSHLHRRLPRQRSPDPAATTHADPEMPAHTHNPDPANTSYTSPASNTEAPAGGQTDRSAAGCRRPRTQHTLRVQHPHRIWGCATRIHPHRTRTRLVHRIHNRLHPYPADRRQHQRSQQHQLFHHRTADLVASPQRQLHEPRPGKQQHPINHVIGQPRRSPPRTTSPSTPPHPYPAAPPPRPATDDPRAPSPHRSHLAIPPDPPGNQNRCRTKPYVGNSTRRPPRSAAGQSTPTPRVNKCPSATSSDSASGRSLASVTTDTACSAVNDCSTAAVRPRPGPTSTKTPAPNDSAARTPSTKRTGCRTCSTQYCGDPYPGPANCPVRFDTNPIRGFAAETPVSSFENCSSMGSINAE